MTRLLLAAFFVEAGLALILVPWSGYWERNYFAEAIPALQSAMMNDYVRGAVSGLGVVNVAAGLIELLSMFAAQRERSEIVSIGRTTD